MPTKVATQLTPRQVANRRNGALGGKARAKNSTSTQRSAWSAKGGNQTVALYGHDYFKHIRRRKKTDGRYRTPTTKK